MKTAKELYPKFDGWFESDYQPMLNEFGKIILQVDMQNYQGDSWLLYQDGEKIGYLNYGWGSCSGCDALQACTTFGEIQGLMNDLRDDVKWFDNKQEALKYFLEHDHKGDYAWSYTEYKEFLVKAIELLSEDKR